VELVTFTVPKSLDKFVIAPIGDIQWSGEKGPTAKDQLARHIDECLELNAYFVGMGDYIDFLSPSNRQRLLTAGLYDTALDVITEKAAELNQAVFDNFLKPTVGRWLGMVEGHHFSEGNGTTTDEQLAELLKTKFLGTSAYIKLNNANLTLYVHHGLGNGRLPGTTLNTLYHVAAGLPGADIYLMGHTTKLVTTRLSRPFPVWDRQPRLEHRDVWLVNCGGFSRSNIVGHRHGTIPRGDYAEKGLMTPSPLAAPIIKVDLKARHDRIRVSI
jgi:hypothetical protein